MNKLAEGVNKVTSNGSKVIVGRVVFVNVGKGVFVTFGVPVGGVVVGCAVLIANKSGVKVAGNPNGVGVRADELVEVGVPKNGKEIGNAVQPASNEMITIMMTSCFI